MRCNNETGLASRMVSSGEVWEVMWDWPVRPGSGEAGRSARETWAPEGKVSLQFLKKNVTKAENWEGWTTPDAEMFWGGRGTYGGRLR